MRLLELTPKQAEPPGPAQTGFFDGHPGPVDHQPTPETKVAFFAALFGARTDIYATRWENTRAGKAGWLPAARGGWRKGVRHEDRDYLPLTTEVLRAHLTGDPVVLRGGMTTKARRNALALLNAEESPLLVVATGPFVGEGFDCPALDTLFLAAPVPSKAAWSST